MTDLPPDTAAPLDTHSPHRPVRADPVTHFFGGSPLWVIVKLAMLSIVIGVILAVLDIDAFAIVRAVQDLFYSFFENIWDAFDTLLHWFMLGAVIVFPIWLISRLLKLGKR
jgi:ABC-type amino acid transport system permease subunit